MFLKDAEGYTPFDLYNSTVTGTNPTDSPDGSPNAELYTWGSNRNAALGIGDGDDRLLPEQVVIRPSNNLESLSSDPSQLLNALKPIPVVGVAMSKLHTAIITGEERSNLRSCGFSGSGRLGPGTGNATHTQFSLINPQETLPHKITAVALGQDHTLAVTSNGEILSWGLNRFHQLGYAFEGKVGTQEEQIQAAARKITGPLRNQVVIGVACCKTASVCWTPSHLFSWGTNHGQLGPFSSGLVAIN
jgi:inhibitor of Bruton tyrosine kinase